MNEITKEISIDNVGEQNSPPQNVYLACILFWTENNQERRKETLTFPLICLKNLGRGPITGIELLP